MAMDESKKPMKAMTLAVGLLVVVVAAQGVGMVGLYRQGKVPHAEPPAANGSEKGGALFPPMVASGGLGGDPDSWDPFQEFGSMRERMEQMFNDSFGRFQSSTGFPELRGGTAFSPSVDIEEREDCYIVRFDMPGVAKSDISINLEDRQLTVSGKVDETVGEKGANHLRRERKTGRFRRSLALPGPVAPEEMDAGYENGVLVVAIPKSKVGVKSKSIRVN